MSWQFCFINRQEHTLDASTKSKKCPGRCRPQTLDFDHPRFLIIIINFFVIPYHFRGRGVSGETSRVMPHCTACDHWGGSTVGCWASKKQFVPDGIKHLSQGHTKPLSQFCNLALTAHTPSNQTINLSTSLALIRIDRRMSTTKKAW